MSNGGIQSTESSIDVAVSRREMEELSVLEETCTQYRLYRIRFYGLTLIILSNIAASLNWLSVATVPDYAATYFGHVSLTAINWFSNMFMLIYLVAGPLSSYIYDRFSLKTGFVAGGVLQTLGAWLRFFSTFVSQDNHTARYSLAMLGQIFCAFGQPFILNSSTPYAALWFDANSRGTVSMAAGLANSFGTAVTNLLIPALVTNADTLWIGFLAIACITSVFAIPTLFIPRGPPTPPSYSASTHLERRQPFRVCLVQLLKNFDFFCIVITFSVLCGLVSAITSLLPQIVGPYGVSVEQSGYLGVAFIVGGLVGAIATGFFVDKTKKYRAVLRVFVSWSGFFFVMLMVVVRPNNYTAIVVICAFLGFFVFSLLPVGLELSVECSYPVSESVSSSMLWVCSQVLGLVFLLSMDALRDDHGDPPGTMRRALEMAAGLSASMSIFAYVYESPNKRLESEQANVATRGSTIREKTDQA
ncbi:hypothetical protein EC973_002838 [Apophysomyces ossiformis]|uniref:Major facilitator superfamily (MFS) profile domain-containing protein n=1 Tax=Apophysomyces ossiformis TaxID=679940 RepID=A0A8H7BHX5_9FUNG|nr:hypothetical protein EC973_002838 [Apophysomyces ossiformis]